jgi:RNA polymerase sigma factor (sigma-70 family)
MDDPQLASPTSPAALDQVTDGDLLRGCRAGDPAAWRAIVERYERLIYSIPLRMGLDRDDAADVFQLTFTALLNSLEAIRDPARLGGWLATVARRHSWATLRRQKAQVSLTDLEAGGEGALASDASALGMPLAGAAGLQGWELALWLDQGLAKLAGRCRELLTALYFDATEPSYADLSTRLGIPVGSIGPTRARCLERLRQVLQGD